MRATTAFSDFDGTFRCTWGSKGVAPGQFQVLCSVVVSCGGEVLVCDATRVQVFGADGTCVRYLHLSDGAGESSSPSDVCVTMMPAGDLAVCHSLDRVICVLPAGF